MTTKNFPKAIHFVNYTCQEAFIDYNPTTKEIDVFNVPSVSSTIHQPDEGFYAIRKYRSCFDGKITIKQLKEWINDESYLW